MLPLQHPDIATLRLDLIAITPAMLRAEKASDGSLAMQTDSMVPPNWPPAEWEPHVLDILLDQYERSPNQIAWHRYAALRQPDGTRALIGALGAFWHEAQPTECEIGYTILPAHEGKGLATEAAQALIRYIRLDSAQQVPLSAITAHTFPHLLGSIRILEKCGFLPDGPGTEPNTIRYRLLLE